jgi:hypothetical protein
LKLIRTAPSSVPVEASATITRHAALVVHVTVPSPMLANDELTEYGVEASVPFLEVEANARTRLQPFPDLSPLQHSAISTSRLAPRFFPLTATLPVAASFLSGLTFTVGAEVAPADDAVATTSERAAMPIPTAPIAARMPLVLATLRPPKMFGADSVQASPYFGMVVTMVPEWVTIPVFRDTPALTSRRRHPSLLATPCATKNC